MNNLYDKIYEAVNTGIQKALIIDPDKDVSIKWHNKELSSEFIPYEYRTINLGLPSGLLWCEYNLGAFPGNMPKDWYGDYYAWGETEIKNTYSQDNYKYCDSLNNVLTKYCSNPKYGKKDDLTYMAPCDDVIYKTLGNTFRMPSKADYKELYNNTTNEWVRNYKGIKGLNGMLFTSKHNANTLFFPAAGYYINEQKLYQNGLTGNNWSASILTLTDYPDRAFYFYLQNDSAGIDDCNRYHGLTVRGVTKSHLKN